MDEAEAKDTKELIDELKLKSAAVETTEGASEETDSGPRIYTDPDGTQYDWDEEKRAWFPKIDEDFIAVYQMNYGFGQQSTDNTQEADEVKTTAQSTSAEQTEDTTKPVEEPVANTGQKRKTNEPPSWFEMEAGKNTNVYVSGLPEETTEEEFVELMNKCGIIMEDNDTRKLKIKLYRDKEGNLKGDARCCYLKIESVDLALKLLDDSNFKGKQIKVEKAHFEMKGTFDASLKPKKKKKKKNKKAKGQEKLLDWVEREEKISKLDRIVVIKNMFDPSDFEKDPTLLLDLKSDTRKECEKYGVVRKVMVFDRHADGVVSIGFAEVEPADECIREMHGRWFAGRKLLAQKWDGVTKYDVEETEEEKEQRLKKWEEYLERKNAEND